MIHLKLLPQVIESLYLIKIEKHFEKNMRHYSLMVFLQRRLHDKLDIHFEPFNYGALNSNKVIKKERQKLITYMMS